MKRLMTLASLGLVLAGCGTARDHTTAGPVSPPGTAAVKRHGLRLIKVGDFSAPVYLTAPPGDRRRRFVVEQAGVIREIRGSKILKAPFLNIRNLVTSGGEQGLLSMAFAPDYAQSKRFYVYYTDRGQDERIVEYHARSPDRADPGSARLVLRIADPESNHNGGLLLFGPDRHLYLGTGDGGSEGDPHGAHGNGQNKQTLWGKLLRIDPVAAGGRPYTVPGDNPFVGGGGLPAIYAYGLRNPWRYAFDPKTGDLVIADVGQDTFEEVDYVHKGGARGANFGWRAYEGNSHYDKSQSPANVIFPVMTFKHSDGWCSITGGVVARDRNVPATYGRYLFGDFCKGQILSAKLKTPRVTSLRRTGLKVGSLSSFGVDARGRVYALSLNGPVYRLASR